MTSKVLLAFLLICPSWMFGQTLHFGTNIVAPGEIIQFSAPLNALGKWEVGKLKLPLKPATGGFIVPQGFDLRRPWPLLIVNVPGGGHAIPMMRAYTNAALSLGYAMLACDGPQLNEQLDTLQFGWGILSTVLEQTVRTWPQIKGWPVVCAGFSGGAKRAAGMAAAMMHENYRIAGIFMGGCNEDRASLGLNAYQPGERFKLVPVFLSNGSTDPIAGPNPAAAVKYSMVRFGFQNLRAEIYEGGHELNQKHLKSSLEWFKSRLPQSAITSK